VRRWQATAILTLFFTAVAGAAAIGWWYARESPPHQGPIVLISVDGLKPSALPVYGAEHADTPGINAFAEQAIVFDRAYAHSPQMLPAHVSMLSGRLPFEHGVRDQAGYQLEDGTRTLAELLRNRGFSTGAAVSSFLLRRDVGLARGFNFFDGNEPPAVPPVGDAATQTDRPIEAAAIERPGTETLDAAEAWAREQRDRRYFLMLQVNAEDADMAVTRISQLLAEKNHYDTATIVLVGDGVSPDASAAIDRDSLRVPLLIKQPLREGAQRRVLAPVQQIDLLPTILDFVRAPIPGDLRGRSLRPILSDEDAHLPPQPIYSESMAAHFRIGGYPLFAVTVNDLRYVRGGEEVLVRLPPPVSETASPDETPSDEPPAAAADEIALLRATLDRLLSDTVVQTPVTPPDPALDRLARAGYLPGLFSAGSIGDVNLVDIDKQQAILDAHVAAARLVGERQLPQAIRALQEIVKDHPTLAVVHYQIGILSIEMGRSTDAIAALETAAALRPDAPEISRALSMALLRVGRLEDARAQADLGIELAALHGSREIAAAHAVAARVALAMKDPEAAVRHADAVQAAEPAIPMRPFVQATLLIEAGSYAEAVPMLEEAAATLRQHGTTLEGLNLQLGSALVQLDRLKDAEAAYRREMLEYPHSVAAYEGLAAIYRKSGDVPGTAAIVDELLLAAPTPEGYAAAVRIWTSLGQSSRAEALRSDARARFRQDPSRPRALARDTQR
jgi:arylsulfatase A-like enzyme/tetratricopeptide (TPR) repeat protein